MKNAITLFLCLLITCSLFGQKIQKSLIREQNSGKKPVSGAQVV